MGSMRRGGRLAACAAAALAAGVVPAVLISTAGGATPPGETVVLGSVTGTPSSAAGLCPAAVRCTYIPFDGIRFAVAPFGGTITSFSVDSAAAAGPVELRVLSSAQPPRFLNDTWTGAGTGPPEMLHPGVNTFAVDVQVAAGDTLALDDESGAPVFDTTSPSSQFASVAYYAPALPDGVTAGVDRAQNARALLMSATIVSGPSPAEATTTTSSGAPPRPATISAAYLGEAGQRGGRRSRASRGSSPDELVFTLDEQAEVTVAITRALAGRISGGACAAPPRASRGGAGCVRSVPAASWRTAAHAGSNSIPFRGRTPAGEPLAPGSYVATIQAFVPEGQPSNVVAMPFRIGR